ncbi:MAG TPA: ATP-dependent DNA helicase [Acidimicrobiia bacterium]|nr:ATP-dependent DNA helicase [Acidimicrobiia bacterium]
MSRVDPSPEQMAVLDLGLETIRIRAGAGTGKTTTVALVIANLVQNHGIEPERILGITFTNKAAYELADRVKTYLGEAMEEGRQAEIHTYHGFAAQILSEFGALAGVDTRLRVITPTFSRQILGETYHQTSYAHLDITNLHGLDRIRTLGDRMGDHLLTPDDLAAHVDLADDVWATRAEMLDTLRRYDDDKRRLGVVDYSDLVTLSTRILSDHPELVTEIRGRYQALILDEYQDTNPAQRVLLTTLFGPSRGSGFPVIAVGDEDQTIYEWRGASAENFELFPSHFPSSDGTPARHGALTLNRRSAPEILQVANLIRRRANPAAEDLVSHDPEARGEVITHWAADAVAEADWIARKFEALHQAGTPWSEMAVLFRKNRDFAIVVDSMARHDIPVEVANLGGLLSVPEVADLRAWLTVIERPEHSPSLVQILFGSRYRLGFADIAPLTTWLGGMRSEHMDADSVPGLSVLEAIEQVDHIEDLRPEARAGLQHFVGIYRDILSESQGASLVEVCRLVLDRTRAWQDVESLPPNQRMTARLNLYRLLDLAEEWSPLRGRPSLAAFLDYLEAMEDEPAEELDSAHLSGEEAVTLVTVHRAKGLEWDVVAIPAVTEKNFPVKGGPFPDPVRFPQFLPPDLRIDEALADMPADEKERMDFFRNQNDLGEWRVAYVAATRARRILILTGSYWYGLPEPTVNAKTPSELFDLVEQHPLNRNEGHADEPPRPPLLRFAATGASPDPLFEDGWEGAIRRAVADEHALRATALAHDVAEPFEQRVETITRSLFDLDAAGLIEIAPEKSRVVSVTGLVTYAQCPKRFFWSEIDPLPRRRNPAAIAGTDLHRRIELHQRGQIPFDDFEPGLYDAMDEAEGSGGFKAFLDSRFAIQPAALIEAPFTLRTESDYEVRGRIDAIYEQDGNWEIVDFKSGRRRDEPARLVQLQAYALAADRFDFGIDGPREIDVSFAYLGGGLDVHTEKADRAWREAAALEIENLTDGIEREGFEPAPGTWCASCDFLRFCPEGRREMGG